jgi:hypothetical protein
MSGVKKAPILALLLGIPGAYFLRNAVNSEAQRRGYPVRILPEADRPVRPEAKGKKLG